MRQQENLTATEGTEEQERMRALHQEILGSFVPKKKGRPRKNQTKDSRTESSDADAAEHPDEKGGEGSK